LDSRAARRRAASIAGVGVVNAELRREAEDIFVALDGAGNDVVDGSGLDRSTHQQLMALAVMVRKSRSRKKQ
jgi:hypothetical protein